MREYYYKIKQTSNIRPQLIELAKSKKEEMQLITNLYTANNSPIEGGFYQYRIDREIVAQDPVLKLCLDTCGNNVSPEIWWLNPNVWYHWHQDQISQCTINMILEVTRSHTWFGQKDCYDYKDLVELSYEPEDGLFLLNGQESHCVANFNTLRSILSMRFSSPWDYKSVKNILTENGL